MMYGYAGNTGTASAEPETETLSNFPTSYQERSREEQSPGMILLCGIASTAWHRSGSGGMIFPCG